MKVVGPLLKRVVYPCLSRAGYLHSRLPPAPIAITYHGVLPSRYHPVDSHLDSNLVTADQFRSQLRFLKVHYEVISPHDFRNYCEGKCGLPARAVLLTCDDGLRNNVTEMLPILSDEHLQCIFFVTRVEFGDRRAALWHEELYLRLSANVNEAHISQAELGSFRVYGAEATRDLWRLLVDKLSVFAREQREGIIDEISLYLPQPVPLHHAKDPAWGERFLILNQDELTQLVDAGMTIGAHTDSHSRLSRMSSELAKREMVENRSRLETILGREVWALAYPFGDAVSVSKRDMALAQQCGFTCAFMNCETTPADAQSRFAFPRVHITTETGLPELEARISGFDLSLRTAVHGLRAKFA
jgi:peptidoglycan/xylan/chitin deacetylase (PgdA/CDA1 family)